MPIRILFSVLALLLVVFGCGKDDRAGNNSEIIDHHFEVIEQIINSFKSQVYSVYRSDDKFYFVKCNKWLRRDRIMPDDMDSRREIEVKINDTVFVKPDHHFETYFILSNIVKDSLEISYYRESHHPYNIRNTKEKGKFWISFENERDSIGELVVDGDHLDSTTALKHMSEGKFYFLVPKLNVNNFWKGNGPLGICESKLFEKYGFVEYELLECFIHWNDSRLVDLYNEEIFQSIRANKNLEFGNYSEFRKAYNYEIWECQQEIAK